MLHTQEYSELLGILQRSHADAESHSNISFLLGLYSGELTPWEYIDLENRMKQKFTQTA